MREQLFINNIEVPLSVSLNPSFNRQISDLKNPEKRKSTYSKNCLVPHSKQANIVFDGIWDINSITGTFDPTIKTDCIYLVDGAEVINGYCQLKKIIKKDNVDIGYSIVIYGNFSSLFKEIKDLYLTDVQGLDTYNHDLTLANQNKSSGNNGETYEIREGGVYVPGALGLGYIYALVDFGFSSNAKDFTVEQIGCSIYSFEYWDRIHTDAGFTYEFLDAAFETHFKHLIVPASPSSFTLDSSEIADREFKSNNPLLISTGAATSNSFVGLTIDDTIRFSTEVSDPGGVYDPATGKFTCIDAGFYTFSSLVDVSATFTPASGASVESVSPVLFRLKMVKYDAVTLTTSYIEESELNISKSGFFVGARSSDPAPTYPSADYDSDVNPPNRLQCSAIGVELLTGDEVYIVWTANYAGLFEDGGGAITSGTATINLSAGSWFDKVSNFSMVEGNALKVEKAIPQKVKQSDFLLNYIKEYNLFVDVDPDKPKHLLYAPRDTFYNSTVIDLTGQVSIDRGIVYKPVGALDASTYLFKHKDDKDYLNEQYSKKWIETYGQREIISTNDFTEKTKATNPMSSPTPIADQGDGNNRVISTIIQIDDLGNRVSTKFNWRTLYYGGLIDNYENWNHISNLVTDVSHTQYPYAGHFDDPFNPTLDINFGLVRELYYDDLIEDITVTDNNLYNKYHSKFIREITDKDSKIVEAFVNISPSDFKTWSFRNLYYFDLAYFRLQEVNGFNPTTNELTKCLFLKLKEVSPFKATQDRADGADTPQFPTTQNGSSGGGVIESELMPLKGISQSPKYDGNNYGPDNNVVYGANNRISQQASEVYVSGDGNKVYAGATNITLTASNNNEIGPNLTDVTLINTDGLVIEESNVTYIDGKKVNPDQISMPTAVEAITASQDVGLNVLTYEGDTSGGDITMTFNVFNYTYTEGQVWNFKKIDAANVFIISVTGATVDSKTTEKIFNLNTSAAIQFDGANFIII